MDGCRSMLAALSSNEGTMKYLRNDAATRDCLAARALEHATGTLPSRLQEPRNGPKQSVVGRWSLRFNDTEKPL